MNKLTDNNKGLSLVELLAVLALTSLILMLIYGILSSGQKQYITQEEKIQNQENVQYVIKHVTKEIRRTNEFNVIDQNNLQVDNVLYNWRNNVLSITKNGQTEILMESLETFYVAQNGNKLSLFVESTGSDCTRITIKTEIYTREENNR